MGKGGTEDLVSVGGDHLAEYFIANIALIYSKLEARWTDFNQIQKRCHVMLEVFVPVVPSKVDRTSAVFAQPLVCWTPVPYG